MDNTTEALHSSGYAVPSIALEHVLVLTSTAPCTRVKFARQQEANARRRALETTSITEHMLQTIQATMTQQQCVRVDYCPSLPQNFVFLVPTRSIDIVSVINITP